VTMAVDHRIVSVSPLRMKRDRRDNVAREALLQRIRSEFEEMACMRLTRPQAQRLFALKPDVCERVLAALVRDGTLCRTSGDRYRLNDSSAWPGPRAFPSHLTSATPKAS
jgi:hypothetical protein